MWIFIQPNDTVFFRDGRPFNAGADIWTGTVFPPYPPSIYGMLRTLLVHLASSSINYNDFFSTLPNKYNDLLGNETKYGNLSICGPFLGIKGDKGVSLYIPSPADFYKKIDSSKSKYYLLQPHKTQMISQFSDMDIPLHAARFPEGINELKPDPVEKTIGWNNLYHYLFASLNNVQLSNFSKEESFWEEEYTTIIERESTRTAKEHQLAHPLHFRLQDDEGFREKGFLIKVDDTDSGCVQQIEDLVKGKTPARLGGECRVSIAERLTDAGFNENEKKNIAERIIKSAGRFRAICTSPAYFPNNAFYPDFFRLSGNGNDKKLIGTWTVNGTGKKVRLVSMVSGGRPVRIGGWDMANKKPKKMTKAVPQGTVYFFELENFDTDQDTNWINDLVNISLPGCLPGGEEDYNKQGFNTFLIGGWGYVS